MGLPAPVNLRADCPSTNYLYKPLNNRTLLGEMKSGAQWVLGAHAPIIRVELREQAKALLSARRRSSWRKKKSLDDSFLLAGLVFGADGRANRVVVGPDGISVTISGEGLGLSGCRFREARYLRVGRAGSTYCFSIPASAIFFPHTSN